MIKNGTLKLEDIMKGMDLNKTQSENFSESNGSSEETKKEETKSDDL